MQVPPGEKDECPLSASQRIRGWYCDSGTGPISLVLGPRRVEKVTPNSARIGRGARARGFRGLARPSSSAVASIGIFEDEGIIEHARAIGERSIGPKLRELATRHASIGEVRGLGVFWALELVRSRTTREPLVPYNASGVDAQPMAEFAGAMRAHGVWPFVHFNRVHFVPPCNVSEAEVDEGIAALDAALEVTDRYYAG